MTDQRSPHIFIDPQWDFITKEGDLTVPQEVPGISTLPIIPDVHPTSSDLFPPHCIQNTSDLKPDTAVSGNLSAKGTDRGKGIE